MFTTLRKTAWAAALAVGGLVLLGTAAARAEDGKREDQEGKDSRARPAARADRSCAAALPHARRQAGGAVGSRQA